MRSGSGGEIVAEVLAEAGVRRLYALCGGHISPILVEAKGRGIRVVDVRHEASAVFAADAEARLGGGVGVAAVTAGPGVTNALTALQNARMAESAVLLLGGAAATLLQGRGALQDVDHLAIVRPVVKWAARCRTVSSVEPTLRRALEAARSGLPGPVFVELPVDVLYPEPLVREWAARELGGGSSLAARAVQLAVDAHLHRVFRSPRLPLPPAPPRPPELAHPVRDARIRTAAAALRAAARPVVVVGSQALVPGVDPDAVAAALRRMGVPVFLAGMARGLLGRADPLQFRHRRGRALREADDVVVAGFPFDFRLAYGRAISGRATLVAAHLETAELRRNRRPDVAVRMHPGAFLVELAERVGDGGGERPDWFARLRAREEEAEARIAELAAGAPPAGRVNALALLRRIEQHAAEDATFVVDGGDFAASAAYVLRPRGPLRWLDPGVFGTLGVGGGFALAAALARPGSETWLLWGDGASAYSLAELDTAARHGLAPICVVGNDGAWSQIARGQVEMLGDDVGTVLGGVDHAEVARGYGAEGLVLDDPARTDEVLAEARRLAASGRPVLVDARIDPTEFRRGSMSM